jgi:hypothetical protein
MYTIGIRRHVRFVTLHDVIWICFADISHKQQDGRYSLMIIKCITVIICWSASDNVTITIVNIYLGLIR